MNGRTSLVQERLGLRGPVFELLAGAVDSQPLAADADAARRFAKVTGHGGGDVAEGFVPPLALCARALPVAAAGIAGQAAEALAGEPVVLQHAAQEVRFEERVPLGSELRVHSEVTEVGDYGFRHGLRLNSVLSLPTGRPVATMRATLVAGPARGEHRLRTRPPELRPLEPIAQATAELAADLPQRYAEVSGDHNPLHLDEAVARAAGFPGVIVHGMATLALAIGAASRSCPVLQAGPLRGVSARMAQPVLPGGALRVVVLQTADPGGVRLRVWRGEAEVLKDVVAWVT